MHFFGSARVLGIELRLLKDNLYDCRFCVAVREKNTILIANMHSMQGTIAEVLEKLPRNIPVALNLTGKGILFKNLHVDGKFTQNEAFQTAFPAVDQKDFYVQYYGEESNFLIHIIRKEIVDDLVDKFGRLAMPVHILTLGAPVTSHLWPLLNSDQTTIYFDQHLFELTELRQFKYYHFPVEREREANGEKLTIGNEFLESNFVVAYAAAMQLLLQDRVDVVKTEMPLVESQLANFLSNAKLKKVAFVFLIAVLTSLTLSYLGISYYNSENARLNALVGTQIAYADQADLLSQNIADNENALKQLHWNGGYNYGFLLNEIGSSLPRELMLKAVSMNDFRTAQEKTECIPNISIHGVTNNLTAVNNWIYLIKEKQWVKSVRLLRYQDDLEGAYQFSLIVTY